MSDWSKVTVRVDKDGRLSGVEVEGEIDREHLTEERPETPPLPDDPDVARKNWPFG
jgi:hypothetical protein